MDPEKIEDVLSENLGEGFHIVRADGELSSCIEWVDWVQQSDADDDIQVEVHFDDGSTEVFEKGMPLRQIWHEDV
jgi:frataxin-like iron-binding protein CyaY